MTVERNVEGLRQNAQKKRQSTLEKVEQGIRQLIKEGKPLNFHTVAQTAGVSKAFLYKEPEIKERIEQLREQGVKKQPEFKQRASDASKDAMIQTLRERVKKLEAEVRDLRKQNEVAYGQVVGANSLRQQVGRLQAENNLLTQTASTQGQNSEPGTSRLEGKIAALGVQLNSTIKQVVQETPKEVIEIAMQSLEEAMAQKRVDNPSGFFHRAVTDAWKPNKGGEGKAEAKLSKEWWELAHARGLVVGSQHEKGVQYVLIPPDQQRVPFQDFLKLYPIETLRG